MKYKLSTAGNFYKKENAEKYKKYGFIFKPTDFGRYDYCMQYTEDEIEIEVESIEDLEKIYKDFDCDLVIDFNYRSIKIYDDYLE